MKCHIWFTVLCLFCGVVLVGVVFFFFFLLFLLFFFFFFFVIGVGGGGRGVAGNTVLINNSVPVF